MTATANGDQEGLCGPGEARSRVAALFHALGQRTIWVGEVGAGTRLKLDRCAEQPRSRPFVPVTWSASAAVVLTTTGAAQAMRHESIN
jgi:hypothetical protein